MDLEIVQSVEDSSWDDIDDTSDSEVSDNEDTDIAGDWETVVDTNVPYAELPIPTRIPSDSNTSTVQSLARPELQMRTTASVAGGLMSTAAASVASLWKWRTSTVDRKS